VTKEPDMRKRPFFLITIDTEGDNVWSRPERAKTRNAEFVERFQLLCEHHNQRPTWLTNHEMSESPIFRRFADDVLRRGTAEIGMHLHAWDSPPIWPLTTDDARWQPYLIEYPPRVMREKIHTLTAKLEDTFGRKMLSHRAGRWSLDERYAEMLVGEGYKVDCSVTPLVSWKGTPGDPRGRGGSDYTNFPHEPYWIDLQDVSRAGPSDLLEVPVTIVSLRSAALARVAAGAERLARHLGHLQTWTHTVFNRLSPRSVWLRPNGRNGRELEAVLDRVFCERRTCAEFMLHSSELMPGGSPTFPDQASIDGLYSDLEQLFTAADGRFRGATLSEFHREAANARSENQNRDGVVPTTPPEAIEDAQ
jgi:hypothetical protein